MFLNIRELIVTFDSDAFKFYYQYDYLSLNYIKRLIKVEFIKPDNDNEEFENNKKDKVNEEFKDNEESRDDKEFEYSEEFKYDKELEHNEEFEDNLDLD